jgi:hypothetical protein
MYGKIDRIGRNRDYERGDGGGGGSVEELNRGHKASFCDASVSPELRCQIPRVGKTGAI